MKYTVTVKQLYVYEDVEATSEEEAKKDIINFEWSDADNIEVVAEKAGGDDDKN